MDQKERNRIAAKKYRDKNKDKIAIRNKQFRIDNPTYCKTYMAKYCADNKEHLLAIKKKWRLANLDKDAANSAKWRANNPEQSKKSNNISSWKGWGIISDDWDKTYDYYINTHYCEYCDEAFINSKDRHLDHDHSIKDDLNIRGVLCSKCNFKDVLKDYFV